MGKERGGVRDAWVVRGWSELGVERGGVRSGWGEGMRGGWGRSGVRGEQNCSYTVPPHISQPLHESNECAHAIKRWTLPVANHQCSCLHEPGWFSDLNLFVVGCAVLVSCILYSCL